MNTTSVCVGVLANFVTNVRAIRLPKLVELIADVNTKAETINQIISNPKQPKDTFWLLTAPIMVTAIQQ